MTLQPRQPQVRTHSQLKQLAKPQGHGQGTKCTKRRPEREQNCNDVLGCSASKQRTKRAQSGPKRGHRLAHTFPGVSLVDASQNFFKAANRSTLCHAPGTLPLKPHRSSPFD